MIASWPSPDLPERRQTSGVDVGAVSPRQIGRGSGRDRGPNRCCRKCPHAARRNARDAGGLSARLRSRAERLARRLLGALCRPQEQPELLCLFSASAESAPSCA